MQEVQEVQGAPSLSLSRSLSLSLSRSLYLTLLRRMEAAHPEVGVTLLERALLRGQGGGEDPPPVESTPLPPPSSHRSPPPHLFASLWPGVCG